MLTRLVTAIAFATTYTALHFAITAAEDFQAHQRFREAPARATALLDALPNDAEAHADFLYENAPFLGETRDLLGPPLTTVPPGFADSLITAVHADQAALRRELDESTAPLPGWSLAAAMTIAAAVALRRRRHRAADGLAAFVGTHARRRPWWWRPVFLTTSGLGLALVVAGFLTGQLALRSNSFPFGARIATVVGGVAALLGGLLVLRYSRPRSARDAVRALRADGRRPVLYLRAFDDDHTAAKVDNAPSVGTTGLMLHTREEQLADALHAFGPVIAVGRPGEPLPLLGAARFYLPDAEWQDGVARLMDEARLVVLRLGSGEGLWWEVERAHATQPPRKLLLLLTDDPGPAARLADLVGSGPLLAGVVPGNALASAAVAFDDDWTPHVHQVSPNRHGVPAYHVAKAMQEALASVGTRKPTMAVRVNLGLLVTLGKGLLIVPVGVLGLRLARLLDLL
ncbi:hypothetical protein [Saccharothrix obliqua]|uniref:hypothetical protein n=1 Tax=Saccharothrix obliqua TaxID=2861747 RepID=UPI001C5DD102|nr:hypothetical protein [Saccharothrix obliqua]MBW4716826.1 hypothetical protein [Saccharothrix obliqua]